MSTTDERALYLQLAGIVGNEPTTSFIEIRPFTVDFQPSAERCWIACRDFDAVAERIAELSPDYHVFIGASPRVREGGKVDDVERTWALWVDCDCRESGEALAAFRPRPSLVVQTRPGRWQGWWGLRHPVRPLWAKRANQRLVKALGSDRAATDAARILRPVTSLNHKTDPPSPVRALRCELDIYRLGEVVGGLPDLVDMRPPAPARVSSNPDATLDGLIRKVRDAVPPTYGKPGERNALLYWAACRVAEHAAGGTLDEAGGRAALHQAALDAGLDQFEIERTLDSALRGRTVA
jgi:hypothetical protein